MSILGLFTQLGISKTIDAQNMEGFKIYPTSFGVSRSFGALVNTRTAPNPGLWFTAPISSRTVVDNNTVKLNCTIPPGSSLVKEFVKEIYVIAKDSQDNEFLLALGQTSEEVIYDPTGTVTLELQLSLADIDLTSTYIFKNTKAQELEEHIHSIDPHPEFAKTLADYGIFMDAGPYAKERMGTAVEFPVQFEGTKSFLVHNGVRFEATFNGNELNGKTIVFDGIKTNDEIRADFNAANYPNTIEHNNVPSGVLPAATLSLGGGSYSLAENDMVYKDEDGVYKRGLADGGARSRIAGYAKLSKKTLVGPGYADINTGFPANTPLYLSGTLPGKITNFNTNVSVGVSQGNYMLFTGYPGDTSANVTQDFDAVVTEAVGAGQFATTQDAINFVPNNGRILIAKTELVKHTIDTGIKSLNFVFNGADTGWKRFLGQATIFNIFFSNTPTQGTWRLEYIGQESNDLPFDASAELVQTEFNLFSGHNGFTVTGDYVNGYTFTSNDLQIYPLPTFAYPGRNEFQKFTFSAVPNDGTVRFRFKGQETLNFPWDDDASDLQLAFDALTSIRNVVVTGSYTEGFTFEFVGGWLQDGNQEQPLIEVVANDLDRNDIPVNINGTTVLPISATLIQKGKKPASNLYTGNTLQTITTVMQQLGEDVGPDRLMNVGSPILMIQGMGVVDDFREGFVLSDANSVVQLQARVINTDKPILSLNKLPTINYDLEIPNFAKDNIARLRLTEHPTNPKRALVSGMDFTLPNGTTLASGLGKLKARLDGAEIDFNLGKVFAKDGVTDIGLDFVKPVITPTMWKWFSVNLLSSGVDPVTNEVIPNLLILAAGSEGATKETAARPATGNNPIGMIALRGALGDKEKGEITTAKDTLKSLFGKTLILNHPAESVAFWFSDPTLDTYSIKRENAVTGDGSDLFASGQTKVLTSKIVLTDTQNVDTVYAWLKKAGLPSGLITVRIIGSTGGLPDMTNVIAVGSPIDSTKLPTDFAAPLVSSFPQVSIPAGTYFVEINVTAVILNTGDSIGLNSIASGTTDIYNRGDADTTYLTTLGNRTGHVALVDKIEGYPAKALTATRQVEIKTLVEGDFQQAVAQKLRDAINADTRFVASVIGNKVTYENADLGAVPDADMGDTGFFNKILVQGTDTDSSGIDDVKNQNIIQFSLGSGGGGVGDANSFTENLKHRLNDSYFNYVTPSVFEIIESKLIDSGTALFSIADAAYKFQAGEYFITKQLLCGEFLASLRNIRNIEIHAEWSDIASTDFAAIYEISIDGGVTFFPVTMTRHGLTSKFTGRYRFSSPTIIPDGVTLDLRMRITAGTNGSKLKAFGVFYDEFFGTIVPEYVLTQERFTFSGDDDRTDFNMSHFTPDAATLKVYDVYSGQIYISPVFSTTGNTVTFPAGTFLAPDRNIELMFEQK